MNQYNDLVHRARLRANVANVDQNDNIKRAENIELRDWLFDLADAIENLQREFSEAKSHAKQALRPFADRVFNDNGSMTIDMQPFEVNQIIAAYFAAHRLK